jgi:hypothetical protein
MTSAPRRPGKGRTAKRPAGKTGRAKASKPRPIRLVWDGLTLSIRYEPSSYVGYAHLQVQVTAPERGAPLPITETGYRSHFLPRGEVEMAGGPAAFVRNWLDEAARSPAWHRRRFRWRQLELF